MMWVEHLLEDSGNDLKVRLGPKEVKQLKQVSKEFKEQKKFSLTLSDRDGENVVSLQLKELQKLLLLVEKFPSVKVFYLWGLEKRVFVNFNLFKDFASDAYGETDSTVELTSDYLSK